MQDKEIEIETVQPKETKEVGIQNMVCAGNSGIMYYFYIYCGKENGDGNNEFEGLQKCSATIARLSQHLHGKRGHKLYFDNLLAPYFFYIFHYLKSKGISPIGTVRANRLHGCPLKLTKDLEKDFGYADRILPHPRQDKALVGTSRYFGILLI